MVSRLGYDTDADFELLRHTLAVTESYKPMLDALTWPSHESSELARIDSLVGSNITVTETCITGQRTAVGCVLHLAELFRQGIEPRASVAVSLSRTALVSSAHIVYVLGAPDPDIRVANARTVLRRQAGSHLSSTREFAEFESLIGLRPPADLVLTLETARRNIGGSGAGEGAMVLEMADSMARVLVGSEYQESGDLGALREHLAWVWHVWSGTAHGWAWQKHVPGLDDDDHDVAPGHWATDFFQLAVIVQHAVRLVVDGLTSRE